MAREARYISLAVIVRRIIKKKGEGRGRERERERKREGERKGGRAHMTSSSFHKNCPP
jgi:ribosome assembly protein YihI (activator of Der GTPase)